MSFLAKNWHFGRGLALLLANFLHLIFRAKNALKRRKLKKMTF